jgi:hypothetical protein
MLYDAFFGFESFLFLADSTVKGVRDGVAENVWKRAKQNRVPAVFSEIRQDFEFDPSDLES